MKAVLFSLIWAISFMATEGRHDSCQRLLHAMESGFQETKDNLANCTGGTESELHRIIDNISKETLRKINEVAENNTKNMEDLKNSVHRTENNMQELKAMLQLLVSVNPEALVTVNPEALVTVNPEVQKSRCVAKGGRIMGGECFSSHPDKVGITRSECVTTCEGKGGKLAEPTSLQEFLQQVISVFPEVRSNAWMGGSDAEEEGTWIYTDGSGVDPKPHNWWPRYPLGGTTMNCLVLSYDGPSSARLLDYPCSSSSYLERHCICQI